MSDLVVSQHIDDLLDSLNASQSRAVLDVPKISDVPSINSFNNLQNFVNDIKVATTDTLNLSGKFITIMQTISTVPEDPSLDNYILVNHNGVVKGIQLDPNINFVYSII
jgi:hypothetical protein